MNTAIIQSTRSLSGTLLRLWGLIIITAVCGGCSLGAIRTQSQMIGTMGTIQGKVANASDHTGPVIVYRYTKKEGVFSLESKVLADEQGGYRFGVSPGTYYIAAFIDIDQDSVLHQDERWNFYGKPSEITVAAGQTVTLETLTFLLQFPLGFDSESIVTI